MDETYLKDLEAERYEANDVETNVEGNGYLENSESYQSLIESTPVSEPDAAEDMEAQESSSLEADLHQEQLEPNIEQIEALEPNLEQPGAELPVKDAEISSDIIEQIEAQDLSVLEAELYTEPLEYTEERAEPEANEYG